MQLLNLLGIFSFCLSYVVPSLACFDPTWHSLPRFSTTSEQLPLIPQEYLDMSFSRSPPHCVHTYILAITMLCGYYLSSY